MPITADHLTYIYGGNKNLITTAVDDISVTIDDGQFIGLIGHTGSGKTTFLQLLSGLIKPESGTVLIDGEDIFARKFDLHSIRGKVGIVFQYPEHQLFEADVFSDVCFGPTNLGLDRKEVELRAYEALKSVGVDDDDFYNSPFELSGGQKRRVAIAGVLAMKPQILILDEPTAGLDPQGRVEILELISRLHRDEHMTIILVSHSMDDVADYAERLIVMEHGQIAYDDVPGEVFKNVRELERMDLGVPEVTYIMRAIKRIGYEVDETTTKVDDAVEQILKLYHH